MSVAETAFLDYSTDKICAKIKYFFDTSSSRTQRAPKAIALLTISVHLDDFHHIAGGDISLGCGGFCFRVPPQETAKRRYTETENRIHYTPVRIGVYYTYSPIGVGVKLKFGTRIRRWPDLHPRYGRKLRNHLSPPMHLQCAVRSRKQFENAR